MLIVMVLLLFLKMPRGYLVPTLMMTIGIVIVATYIMLLNASGCTL
jgi:hypothetical protein